MDDILLQQEPFRFVDRMLCYQDRECTCAYTVGESLLCENGHLSAEGLIENMAQSAAARAGYMCKYILHIPTRIGMIGDVKHLKISRLPSIGETLLTDVRVIEDVFGITMMEVGVHAGNEQIASAIIKTAVR